MKRILSWFLWLPVAVLIIAFVVANRQMVALSLDPFGDATSPLAMPLPLWAVFIFGLFVGIIVGWSLSWLKQSRHRKAARRANAELEKLRQQSDSKPAEPDPAEPFPMIGSI